MKLLLRLASALFMLVVFISAGWNGEVARAQTSTAIDYVQAVVEDSGETGSEITVTWGDTQTCSSNYKAVLRFYNQIDDEFLMTTTLGSVDASSDTTQINGTISDFDEDTIIRLGHFQVLMYCTGDPTDRLVSLVKIARISRVVVTESSVSDMDRVMEGTFSSKPPITALTISEGTLSPSFSQGTTSYTITGIDHSDLG